MHYLEYVAKIYHTETDGNTHWLMLFCPFKNEINCRNLLNKIHSKIHFSIHVREATGVLMFYYIFYCVFNLFQSIVSVIVFYISLLPSSISLF